MLCSITYLSVFQVVFEPLPHVGGGQAVPDVHEAQASDVRTVAVVQQAQHLLAGQLQCKQFEEEAKRRRHDSCVHKRHVQIIEIQEEALLRIR